MDAVHLSAELLQVDWSDAMYTFPNEDSSFEDNSLSYWKPMKLSK